MPSKNQFNSKEVLKDLEKKISPLLVVNNNSLKPYVEIFEYAPENIYQQPLGSLIGFFEIKEYSEDSAYIVNFLTSVLKKEYYANPKRPVTESLDSALHKVNLALSELAKHGNVQWLGRLNAVICVLEKNSAHFSVAGSAKMFLFRNTTFTDISEDLAADSTEPHPLKTFVNVSSGRLEKNDRLLITTEDIFHLFTDADLKKNFQRFEGEKFVQLLRTALSNQMEMIATMVVDLKEPETEKPAKIAKKKTEEPVSYFSEKTFVPAPALTEELSVEQETSVENDNSANEYTDKKTGHIYVQGEVLDPTETSKVAFYLEITKEKIGEFWYLTKNETRRKFISYKKQVHKKIELHKAEKARLAALKEEESIRLQEQQRLQRIEYEKAEEESRQKMLLEKQEAEIKNEDYFQNHLHTAVQTEIESEKDFSDSDSLEEKELSFQEKLQLAIKEQQVEQQKNSKQSVIDLRTPKKVKPELEIEEFENEITRESDEIFQVPVHQQSEIDDQKRKQQIENIKSGLLFFLQKTKDVFNRFSLIAKEKSYNFFRERKVNFLDESRPHLSPRFSKIKNNFSKFTNKQKNYTILILFLIFIVPFFIARFLNKSEKPTIAQLPTEKPLTQADILSGEKNITTGLKEKNILSASDLKADIIATEYGVMAFTSEKILLIDSNSNKKEFEIPQDKGLITKVTYMNDLAMVLLITSQEKVISFSPISQKFTDNNINLTGETKENFFGTYLTYMYVLDTSNGQIYRYPRAEGGFGEKTNWLKSKGDFSKISSFAIDDGIWITDKKQISRYFKGANEKITFEASTTSINYDYIYTNLNSKSLYVLDKLNSRIVSFAKETGTIEAQYHSEKLYDAISFTVDEKNKTAYAVTSEEIISILIQ